VALEVAWDALGWTQAWLRQTKNGYLVVSLPRNIDAYIITYIIYGCQTLQWSDDTIVVFWPRIYRSSFLLFLFQILKQFHCNTMYMLWRHLNNELSESKRSIVILFRVINVLPCTICFMSYFTKWVNTVLFHIDWY
jgi:hypothetical protein